MPNPSSENHVKGENTESDITISQLLCSLDQVPSPKS